MSLFSSLRHHDDIPKDKQIQNIPLDQIKPNRFQPRRDFSQESIRNLATTIEEEGLLQPIVIREIDKGYEIIAGERRYRAVASLGWQEIPAIVNNLADSQAASLALIENLQRENLNPIDEAQALADLLKLNKFTQAELAKNIGKSQSYVANKLRLLKLTPKVQSYIVSGQISARHGRCLVNLPENQQGQVIDEVVANNLNVKETEEIARDVDVYFANKKKAEQSRQKQKQHNRVVNRLPKDLKVQINTIKRAVKLAKDSGIQVNIEENNNPDDYKIMIELKRK